MDAFSLLVAVQTLLNEKKEGSKIIATDSFLQDDNISYLIDYEVNSVEALGSKSKGSVYIRGIKGG